MKIAVLSGKGGAGKTFVSVNLAASANRSVYIDCDVEEPNGRLFFKPENRTETSVAVKIPEFDMEKCIGCRACVDFCRFNALVFIKNRPKLFSDICHSCGGCKIVCPAGAVQETNRKVGVVEKGKHRNVSVVTGILDLGEESGVPVIKKALEIGCSQPSNVIIDCPPGSSCAVSESIQGADYCILVAEPSAFGFHNFKMIFELVHILQKPCGVVINKQDQPYLPLEEFCREHDIQILERIPYRADLAACCARGQIASEANTQMKEIFQKILSEIGGKTT